jgi:hypothetical protein
MQIQSGPDGTLKKSYLIIQIYNILFPSYYLAGHRDAGRRGGERLVAAVVLEPDDGNDDEAGQQEGQRDPGQDTQEGGELQRHRRLRVWKKGDNQSLEKCVGRYEEDSICRKEADQDTQSLEKMKRIRV